MVDRKVANMEKVISQFIITKQKEKKKTSNLNIVIHYHNLLFEMTKFIDDDAGDWTSSSSSYFSLCG
jgi:hypothetical protein